MAVINAPGAAGAKVMGYLGLRLDGKGTAVVDYLQPYQMNGIAIDPEGTDQGVELNARVNEGTQRLQISWGRQSGQACTLKVPALKEHGRVLKATALCLDDTQLTDVDKNGINKSAGL